MGTGDVNDEVGVRRVVILGGGPAGVAAAYWLSAPEQNGRYRVTLYTQGWRLGGKCASGRNADKADRIEEHGLHMLMGCYQNAFATLRNCYAEWRRVKIDPENPFQTWRDAFLPQRLVTLMECDGDGAEASWSPWNFPFPWLPGEPGDGPLAPDCDAEEVGCEGLHLIHQMIDWAHAHISPAAEHHTHFSDALHKIRGAMRGGDKDEALHVSRAAAAQVRDELADCENDAEEGVTALAEDVAQFGHRIWILADLALAIGHGYLRDVFLRGPEAYDHLDRLDFRAWLASCGAAPETIASAPARAFYDLTFAVIEGDERGREPGTIAAGAALRAQMEIALGYRDAPLWKMAAGMGDTVFTPFYDVLTARGVEIQFFSRALDIRPADDDRVGEIDIAVQATTVDGAPYRPLVRVNHLDCWPNQPQWHQLNDGAALKARGVNFEYSGCDLRVGPPLTLKAGVDFDLAVVAMPPEALARVGGPLIAASERWRDALAESRSVATQSLQLWMRPDLEGLGWTDGPTVATSFVEPYDSWGDMSQVILRETWTPADAPGSIAYLCGCMTDPAGPVTPAEMTRRATLHADHWFDGQIQSLWPGAEPSTVDNPQIVDRYDVANFDLSDQYVQTPAGGNVAARFSSGEPAEFRNLYVVGDWTKTRFSGGAFECAVESAMLASRAISGFPQAIKTA